MTLSGPHHTRLVIFSQLKRPGLILNFGCEKHFEKKINKQIFFYPLEKGSGKHAPNANKRAKERPGLTSELCLKSITHCINNINTELQKYTLNPTCTLDNWSEKEVEKEKTDEIDEGDGYLSEEKEEDEDVVERLDDPEDVE